MKIYFAAGFTIENNEKEEIRIRKKYKNWNRLLSFYSHRKTNFMWLVNIKKEELKLREL